MAVPQLVLAQAASGSATERLNILTPEERAAGWRLLFDGHSTVGWRGRQMDSMPSGWGARAGERTRVQPAAAHIHSAPRQQLQLTPEPALATYAQSGRVWT